MNHNFGTFQTDELGVFVHGVQNQLVHVPADRRFHLVLQGFLHNIVQIHAFNPA